MLSRVLITTRAALKGEIRVFNFLVVGGLNTIFGYGVFALMLWMGLHYSLAIAIATILGTFFNFKSIGTLVFRSHDNSKIVRFILVYASVYCVNVIGVAALLRIGINTYQSGLLMILILAPLAYLLNCHYVFKHA